MEEVEAVEEEAAFTFTLPQPEPIGIPVLQIKEVRVPRFQLPISKPDAEQRRLLAGGILLFRKRKRLSVQ